MGHRWVRSIEDGDGEEDENAVGYPVVVGDGMSE